MGRYRKVEVGTWLDEKFTRLSAPAPNGRYLWFYLLTNPDTVNVPGLYRCGEAAMAEAIGWPLKAFREAFAEVLTEGMVKADWTARVIWLRNAIKYNEPESPNVVRSWRIPWDEIPACSLKSEAYQHLKAFLEGKGEGFSKAFLEACRKPLPKTMPNQEQEQEQEQEQDKEDTEGACGDFEPFWNLYPSRNGKKAGKQEARKEWERLAPSAWQAGVLMHAVAVFKQTDEALRGIGIPDAERWLKHQRWTDEIGGNTPQPPRPLMTAAQERALERKRQQREAPPAEPEAARVGIGKVMEQIRLRVPLPGGAR
jgi:hypothetical protein